MPGYRDMPITEAAQAVQRSGFPDAYADHEQDARALASALTGKSTGGAFILPGAALREKGAARAQRGGSDGAR